MGNGKTQNISRLHGAGYHSSVFLKHFDNQSRMKCSSFLTISCVYCNFRVNGGFRICIYFDRPFLFLHFGFIVERVSTLDGVLV
jgi:hypothetical protein